jgi:hypothetical protein
MTESNYSSKAGKALFNWQVPEYEKYERSKNWYVVAIAIALGLLFFSFFTLNFLFALIIVTASLVVIMHHGQEPPILDVKITEEGIVIGKNFYEYDAFKNFAIVYKPRVGVKQLYLEFNNWWMHRLSLPLFDNNPVPIREALLDFMDEDTDRTDPPYTESIAKILKL